VPFSTFPGGMPGIGLLLLRATIGVTGIVQSCYYLAAAGSFTLESWIVGLLGIAGSTLLALGLLTQAAGAAVGAGYAAVALTWGGTSSVLFIDRLAALFGLVTAVAIVLLGPGAFSLDARLFGRREIFIPRQIDRPSS